MTYCTAPPDSGVRYEIRDGIFVRVDESRPDCPSWCGVVGVHQHFGPNVWIAQP